MAVVDGRLRIYAVDGMLRMDAVDGNVRRDAFGLDDENNDLMDEREVFGLN